MRKSLLSIVTLFVLGGPAHAHFCPGANGSVFTDVLGEDPFCSYITWAAQNGITQGCLIIDANRRLYCPNDGVARSQMAAFVNRLATQPDTTARDVGTITKPGGAFLHNFGINSTFLGVNAGNFVSGGSNNTGVGHLALNKNSNGQDNTAVGALALSNSLSGIDNTAIGVSAMGANTAGISNTAVGALALGDNSDGHFNTAVGWRALRLNNGHFNTSIGYAAAYGNATGLANVAVGLHALLTNAGGAANTAVGTRSLYNATGNLNIALGYEAGLNLTTGTHNVHIGHPGNTSDDKTIRIGDMAIQAKAFLAAVRGVSTGMNDAVNVVVDSNGQLGTISSSRDTKDDIADMSDASAGLRQLRPVTFHYRADQAAGGPRLQYGLIAEEVAAVYPGMVATKDGKPETVMYQYLAPMLLNEYQKQQRTIEAQRAEIAELKETYTRELSELRGAVEALMARAAADERMAAR